MTTLQKVIKWLAIALAVFLIVAIVASIVGVVAAIAGIHSLRGNNTLPNEHEELTFNASEIQTLDMEIGAANIQILSGDELRVETDNPCISIYTRLDGTLYIEEESHIGNLDGSTLTIYIPDDMVFDHADITTGAGVITLETLTCRKLELELGAGKAELENLTVTGDADIDGGAGQLIIKNSSFHDLSFDMGVGQGNIDAALTGDSDITAGIGALHLTVLGNAEDYTVHAEQCLGRVEVDNRGISGEYTIGSGPNRLNIEGGIGNISVDFEN